MYKTVFLLATVVITVCGAERRFPCGNKHLLQWYNPEKLQCCNGTLANLTQDGEELKCCISAGKTYKAGSQTCCGKEVNDKRELNLNKYACCDGQRYYDIENEICCNGKALSRYGNKSCCGSNSYNINTHRCCETMRYPLKSFKGSCCGNMTYDDSTHDCHDRNDGRFVLERGMDICGSNLINTTYQTCCDGAPVNYTGNFPPQCCGQNIFYPNTHHCHKGHVLEIGRYWCEEAGPFYPGKQFCCDGNILNRTDGTRQQCCGSGIIDLDLYICCNNKPYENSLHCCGGKAVEQPEKCCGDIVLEDSHVCCNGNRQNYPVRKSKDSDDGCCKGKPYFKAISHCTYRGPVPWTDDVHYCGKKVMDNTSDHCCENVLFKDGKKHKDFDCCGSSLLNTTYEDCINGRPENKTKERRNRCGKKRYRKRKDMCCNNVLHKGAKTLGKTCCGGSVYDANKQECCHGEVKQSCNKRRTARHPKDSPLLMCTSTRWVRRGYLKKISCIENVYILKKRKTGDYRVLKHFGKREKRGRLGTWDVRPHCPQVNGRKRFILLSLKHENYTMKYSKSAANDIRKNNIRFCNKRSFMHKVI